MRASQYVDVVSRHVLGGHVRPESCQDWHVIKNMQIQSWSSIGIMMSPNLQVTIFTDHVVRTHGQSNT